MPTSEELDRLVTKVYKLEQQVQMLAGVVGRLNEAVWTLECNHGLRKD